MSGRQLISMPRVNSGRDRAGAVFSEAGRYLSVFAASLALSYGGGGVCAPIAAGFVTASPPGLLSLAAACGAILGYFLSEPFENAAALAGIVVLSASAVFSLRESKVFAKPWFRPLTAGVITACVCVIDLVEARFALAAAADFFLLSAVAAAAAWGFYEALFSPRGDVLITDENLRRGAYLVSAGMTAAALAGIRLGGVISLGRLAASVFVLLAAFSGGLSGGAVCGAAAGFASDAASGSCCFTVSFTVGGIFAALTRKSGRVISSLAYFICLCLSMLWLRDSSLVPWALPEVLAAGAAFCLLPRKLVTDFGRFFPKRQSGCGSEYLRERERRRASSLSRAFISLSESARRVAGIGKNDEDPAAVFDAACERVCRSCKNSGKCWQEGYQDTLRVFNDLTPTLRRNGFVTPEDFPDYFSEKCRHLPDLSAAITEESRAQALWKRYRARASEKCGAAAEQYSDVAEVLSHISDSLGPGAVFDTEAENRLVCYLRSLDIDASAAVYRDRGGRLRAEITSPSLGQLIKDDDYINRLSAVLGTRLCAAEENAGRGKIELSEAEPLSASVGVAAKRRRGEKISGDRAACFKTEAGSLCVILSDGAGSGRPAEKCSADAVTALENLLRAGISPKTALRLLNSLLSVEMSGGADSAAVDLLCLDLFTGTAELYKSGSPASFALSGRTVRRLDASPRPPLGAVSGIEPERLHLRLSPGASVILLTDGVTAGLPDAWLREALLQLRDMTPQEKADAILKLSAEKFGEDDDMTAVVVALEERA
ncbi:MAG: SpoIIE family protein phosphatase [Oscillospiraceae bacterium]|nr:SpoIIE family protein phosphatase [Oscillospiraceae bacterium]